jgi:HK97 family phage prohead protease
MSKDIMKKLEEGRQYRNMASFEKRADTDEKIVEGYATTFNDPYVLYQEDGYTVVEQVDRNAFNETDMSDVIMQYDHEGRVFARGSNGTLELDADNFGLHIRANLGGTEIGRQLYDEIAGGYTNKMSFGFRVAEDKREITEDRDKNEVTVLRTITKISKLYDVSAVSLPANDGTSISSRTLGEGIIAEARAEIAEREKRTAQINRINALLED